MFNYNQATPLYTIRNLRWQRTTRVRRYPTTLQTKLGTSIGKQVTSKFNPNRHRSRWRKGSRSLCANTTTFSKGNSQQRSVKFDSDSKLVGIDNRCSACISPDINDFVGRIVKSNNTITGFGGTTITKVYRGTIAWSWYDDEGALHRFKIPH